MLGIVLGIVLGKIFHTVGEKCGEFPHNVWKSLKFSNTITYCVEKRVEEPIGMI